MFRLRFNTDNDAFADDPHGEMQRILLRIAGAVRDGEDAGGILDNNGNRIGQWHYEAEA